MYVIRKHDHYNALLSIDKNEVHDDMEEPPTASVGGITKDEDLNGELSGGEALKEDVITLSREDNNCKAHEWMPS